jgi:hypothetical protein
MKSMGVRKWKLPAVEFEFAFRGRVDEHDH